MQHGSREEVGGGGCEILLEELISGTVTALLPAEDGGHAGLAVLGAEEVVEHGVEGGGEVVAAPRQVEEVLVDQPEQGVQLEVHVAQPLHVERAPGHEEQHNYRHWG